MGCGNYEEMARGMGFDCGQFSDEQKTQFAAAIDDLVKDGMSEEDAIREVMKQHGHEPMTFTGAGGGAIPEGDVTGEWPNERVNACRNWGEVRVCFKAGDAEEPQEVKIGRFRGVLDPARGQLHVYDVPIFVACKRGKKDFSLSWMADALVDAKQGEADGYYPPMHVVHHGSGDPVAAGVFKMTRIEDAPFKDEMRPTLFGTLIFTNPTVIGEFLAGRLPYRSVEVMDFTAKKIDSLALLDHEPPFLELPMTANVEIDKGFTFSVSPSNSKDPVVAYFSRGNRSLLVQENDMVSDYTPIVFQKDDDDEKKKPADEEDGGDPTGGESPPAGDADESPIPAEGGPEAAAPDMGEDMGADPAAADPTMGGPEGGDMGPPPPEPVDAGPDTSWMEPEETAGGVGPVNTDMIVTAILEGTIAVKDFHAIQQAISQVEAAAQPQEEVVAEEEVVDESVRKAPPAAAPGEAMQRNPDGSEDPVEMTTPMDPEKAAMMGRLEALEEDKRVREDEAAIKQDVDDALERLEGRSLGENPRDRYTLFRRTHGAEAFSAYVDELAKELPPKNFGTRFGASNPEAFDFGRRLPDEVLAFQKDGSDAMAKAAKHAADWEELQKRGMNRVSLERHLEINMAGLNNLA